MDQTNACARGGGRGNGWGKRTTRAAGAIQFRCSPEPIHQTAPNILAAAQGSEKSECFERKGGQNTTGRPHKSATKFATCCRAMIEKNTQDCYVRPCLGRLRAAQSTITHGADAPATEEQSAHCRVSWLYLVAHAGVVAHPSVTVALVLQHAVARAPALVAELERHVGRTPHGAVFEAHLGGAEQRDTVQKIRRAGLPKTPKRNCVGTVAARHDVNRTKTKKQKKLTKSTSSRQRSSRASRACSSSARGPACCP